MTRNLEPYWKDRGGPMRAERPRSGQPGSTEPMHGLGDLALALGGSEDSYTGHLLKLIAKADPDNRERLRLAYPHVVHAWELWMAMRPTPTADELQAALEADAEFDDWLLRGGEQLAAALDRAVDTESGLAEIKRPAAEQDEN